MLTKDELFAAAEFIHNFNDESVELHNSRCSYVWKSVDVTRDDSTDDPTEELSTDDSSVDDSIPIGQEWVVYFMNTTRIGSKVELQFAKLGSHYIYSNVVMKVDASKFNQYHMFDSFVTA